MKKGSQRRAKAKKELARLHMKIANSRRYYFHKLSNDLSSMYDVIYMENLNMRAMQKLWGRKMVILLLVSLLIS
jgi:putative transposase